MAINKQTPEAKLAKDAGLGNDLLDVIDVWPTIQGEGPFAGKPAVFVRLAGCNLMCPLCDTDYTSNRALVDPYEVYIRAWVVRPFTMCRLMVLTGGEPLRQNVFKLIDRFTRNAGWDVQVETNGSLIDAEYAEYAAGNFRLHTVVSPKTGELNQYALKATPNLTYKYVIEDGFVDPTDGLPTRVLGYSRAPARPHHGYSGEVYVQPLDSYDNNTEAHIRTTAEVAMRWGYRLSIQTHKLAFLK